MNARRIAMAVVWGCTVTAMSASAQTQGTWRVSVDSSGVEGSGASRFPSISGDGRFVAFGSSATNLVAGDSNSAGDVFVHDRQTGTTTRVSVDSSGAQGNNHSDETSISADGQFVAFQSAATNLVPGDTNGWTDVFVHDRETGTTTRVSVDSSGVEGNLGGRFPSIAGDGRFVAFESSSSNLVPGDTNGWADAIVHDCQTGTTTRVSVDSSGAQGNDASAEPSISGDGRFVAFASRATNLVSGDTNGKVDAFAHDRQTGTTTRVSVDSAGAQGNDYSQYSSISGGGRFVAFTGSATNLVPGDSNSACDVFVHDRQTATTTRVSVDSSGLQGNLDSIFPSISADGRFVAFESSSDNLVPSDTNGVSDVLVHGSYLTLEANPETVSAGATLTLTTWTGKPTGLAILAVVDINGTPMFVKVTQGNFDSSGLWALSGTAPSSLAGNVVTFLSFGIAPTTNKATLTNQEAVTFQ